MIRLTTLFSGSSGNAVLIDNGEDALLVDCGVSGKRLCEKLNESEISRLRALLVTHEHSDHIAGVGVVSRKWKLPVYATDGTLGAFPCVDKLTETKTVCDKENFRVGSIRVTPFHIPHDAAEPVGYRFSDGENEVGLATDMGFMNRALIRNLIGCESVLLEANHDLKMLAEGPYPYYLKQRISGTQGHLSNRTAAISSILLAEHGTKRILLGHLSQENNTPRLAYETVEKALFDRGFQIDENIVLGVAKKEGRSEA